MKPAAGQRPRVRVVGFGAPAPAKKLKYAARERHSSTIEENRP